MDDLNQKLTKIQSLVMEEIISEIESNEEYEQVQKALLIGVTAQSAKVVKRMLLEYDKIKNPDA